MEDLYSDHDSEDELDHDIADLEDMTVRCDNPFALLMQNICMLLHSPELSRFPYKIFDSGYFYFAEYMQLLGGFSDVAKDEKRIMHMWNSFKRKQRSGLSPVFPSYGYHRTIFSATHLGPQ